MATSKFLVFYISLLFALFFTLSEADSTVTEVVVGSDNCEAFRIEVNKLTSKIQALESFIDKRNQELKSKDEIIAQKEKDCITSLQSESYVDSHWKEYGKTGFQLIWQKVLEKKAQAQKWVESHVETIKTSYAESHWKVHGKSAFESFMRKALEKKETIKTKWVPLVITYAEPYLQSLAKNIKYVYIQSKDVATQQCARITRKIYAFLQA